ncbi:threonine ammonia-lyase [Halospeciosus flavus]|uniref:threonine ammonia-lyase n=1 Tax=Halospeciosus flavus TaxID=3032283 RepID=A0ABD5Z7Y4_9EURY|nr:threonine ammonia-lyase [Halospeciosus flavus]
MLELDDVLAAEDRIADVARRTPLDYSHTFSAMTGAEVHTKMEMFQRTGSFKIRGAANRIRTLSEADREAGVVTASAGNHAQGVALAASRSDVDATVVMPETAPISKVKATRSYGANVVLHGVDYDEAQARAHEIEEAEGRTYVHAFDDEDVMAGQGTLGLEVVDALPEVDTVVVPIGGGGLISGVATAVKERSPDTRVIGVQAEGASSVADSLQKGNPQALDAVDTIADGIAVRKVGEHTFPVIRERVDDVVTVSDDEIATAVVYLLERGKTLVEAGGAVGLAALLEGKFVYEEDEVVVPVLSGGNIDLNLLTTVVMRGLVDQGRYVKLRTVLKDRPGSLQALLDILAEERANIYAIQHDRTNRDVAMNAAEVELDLETRGEEHVADLLDRLEGAGYDVELLV